MSDPQKGVPVFDAFPRKVKEPRLQLAPDWRRILVKAWSIRFLALALLLTGLEAALPFIPPDLIPDGVLGPLTGLTVAAAFGSRLIAQKEIHEIPPTE